MGEPNNEFDPEERDARDVAAKAGEERSEFMSLMPHYYRGEVSQMSTRLDRLDLTIDWAIAVIVAMLALSFQSTGSPPYFLLIGMFALMMFLLFDVRRYRTYDATRSRVRMIEENVFANAFDPKGSVHRDWREKLGHDLREPTLKVSLWEALSRRLKHVYFPLETVLVVAWLFRITAFVPKETPVETAAVPGISGEFVIVGVLCFYVATALLTFWPTKREAKGEFHGEKPGEWKVERR
ncbi:MULTISPECIES: DUF2270 domain-containing protein [unclassified Haladaptatus]|uniref:DUF2270 domain-containing protein n=1 Tax=unclassified Haladaptatus TaxID=2622732 RepID=UPI00209C2B06|nr:MULTISPECIES: DUF2270 domain-containing protein [unclassified Haladaptatus]MCO8245744.1 DUF2270 domain-containing protein [Haladaptatus sp. AB643]MCO8256089.1 DUF2270 domain-containing protein [Haladaptatus sp. AB618]